jgi:7-cyano-7-deazaguanine synthase
MRRVLLLSGGMDSTAVAYVERPDACLMIDYGQDAAPGELRASHAVADVLGLPHEMIQVDCRRFGSGDLAGSAPASVAPVPEWWPFRNQLLLTAAAMHLTRSGPAEILIGTVSTDAAHADGRPEFVAAMDQLLSQQEGGMRLRAPAILHTTAAYILTHNVPDELLGWAHSCHVGEWACGECRGCNKYRMVMDELHRAGRNA